MSLRNHLHPTQRLRPHPPHQGELPVFQYIYQYMYLNWLVEKVSTPLCFNISDETNPLFQVSENMTEVVRLEIG